MRHHYEVNTSDRLVRVLVLLLAVTAGGCDRIRDAFTPSPSSPTVGPPAAGAAISYAAIGASDALGIGGSVPCQLFTPCESGTGYVQRLTRELRAQNHETTLVNLGIPAAVLSPAIHDLARANNRDVPANFIDHALTFVPASATLVTIFGGANDANAVGDAMRKGAAGSDLKAFADAQIQAFGRDYDRLVQGVRDRAPNAFIIVINVPNLAVMPYASGYTQQEKQVLQHLAVGFTREANSQAGSGIVVLDLMCDASAYEASRVASDGFHPNDNGYEYLMQRLLAIVNGASTTAASSCAAMSVVPPL
jgi:lysophospholipase L1-like esterase